MRKSSEDHHITKTFNTTDRIMNDTFWIGVYPGMSDEMIDKMIEVIKEEASII